MAPKLYLEVKRLKGQLHPVSSRDFDVLVSLTYLPSTMKQTGTASLSLAVSFPHSMIYASHYSVCLKDESGLRTEKQKAFSVHFSKNFSQPLPIKRYMLLSVRRCKHMRKSIEDNYYGRFSAIKSTDQATARNTTQGSRRITRCEEALRGKTEPDEVKLLRDILQACADLSGISCIENFTLGFHRRAASC